MDTNLAGSAADVNKKIEYIYEDKASQKGLASTMERKKYFSEGPGAEEILKLKGLVQRLVSILEKRQGFAPLDLSGWGIPDAYAVEAVVAGAVLEWESSFGAPRERTVTSVIRSRLGLPFFETKEKLAFVYTEEGGLETGLFATAPAMLEAYPDSFAGIVAPPASMSAIQNIKNRIQSGKLVVGEKLEEVLQKIASFKPGRAFLFKKPDEFLPASLTRNFERRLGVRLEIRSSPLDLERFKSSDPELADQIEALRNEVRLLGTAA